MATTLKTDVLVPEVLLDVVKAGLAGMPVMRGTGAAVVRTGLPAGKGDVGKEVVVPYFGSIGAVEELVEGQGLTPRKLTQTDERAVIGHAGIAVAMSHWSLSGAGDPYEEAGRQILEAMGTYWDQKLIDAAASETDMADYIVDAAALNETMTYDHLVQIREKFGDEAKNFATFVCHSKVYSDMLRSKDSAGRPILVDLSNPQEPVLNVLGIPILQSDRLAPVGGTYKNLLLKKGSLVLWLNSQSLSILEGEDILADTRVMAVHSYQAVHRYKRMNLSTKPGVGILKTK